MDAPERDALLMLTLVSGLAPRPTRRALESLGSAQAVVSARPNALAAAAEIKLGQAQRIADDLRDLAGNGKLDRERELIERHGVTLVTLDDGAYPKLLRHIPDPPPLLFVRGRFDPGDSLALAIVGARRCSTYGREQADRLASLCSSAGLCIVSGGAYGVDAAAHRAALRAGGRTIAVIGSGLANPYPAEHAELFDEIAAGDGERGAVVSELPMTAPPMKENFPARNRIISGLSLGVLVVEASLRSGALITARMASEDHNREVMALPGRVDNQTSAGCHKIIREGWATLVTSAADILDALGPAGQTLKGAISTEAHEGGSPSLFEQNLTDSQRRIFEALAESRDLDGVAAHTGLPVATIQADLTMLQIRSLITREGGRWSRRR
jgi:DNA processing protein